MFVMWKTVLSCCEKLKTSVFTPRMQLFNKRQSCVYFLKETAFVHQFFFFNDTATTEIYTFDHTLSHVQTRNWSLRRQEEMHLHGRWVSHMSVN
jgi:hypothetical protein